MSRRTLATLHLPMELDTVVAISDALDKEFPGAVVVIQDDPAVVVIEVEESNPTKRRS